MNNLNLIIGEDRKVVEFYLSDILSKVDYLAENKISYDMSVSSISDILDEASMISLFSSIKVIIGNNFDINKIDENDYEYLNKYIKNINKNVYIILIASKIDARVKKYKAFKDNFNIIEISKLNNDMEIINYVRNVIKDSGYKINDYDIDYFTNRVGNDIHNINLELDKLFIYKENDKTINHNDIELLTTDNIENVIYEFTNAVVENDTNEIKRMYDNFKKENISIDYLISSLANVFRQILIIKILHNDGKSNLEISKVIGKKEFYVKKMLEKIYRYDINDICGFINKLAQIEINYKSGKSNIDELELFLYDIIKDT